MLKDYELLCNRSNHWDHHPIHQETLKIKQIYMSLFHYFVLHLANPNETIYACIEEVKHSILGDDEFKSVINIKTKQLNRYAKQLSPVRLNPVRLNKLMNTKDCIDYRVLLVVDALYLLETIILDLKHNRIAIERLPNLLNKLMLSKRDTKNLRLLITDLFEDQDQRFSNELIKLLSAV